MAAIEDAEHKSFGSSLPVPCVQEMVRQAITTIPPRYVIHDRLPSADQADPSLPTVPVIDMQKLLSKESADHELSNLHSACKNWGFFQVINHGINASLLGKMKSEAEDIFNLPLDDKKKLWQKPGDLQGFGQIFVVSEDQKLDWADVFYIINFPAKIRNRHLYENLPHSFREALESYAEKVQGVAMSLLGSMGRALKIAEEEMIELFDDGFQAVRMNYYPPCPEPEKVMGISPHSDLGALTILFQANEVQGLEVSKDGKWIPIKPIKNAFVVNVGDTLEMISNGAYKSIMHRATVNSKQARISISAFHCPNHATEVGPAKSLITPENPPLYERIKMETMAKKFVAKELKGKSVIESLKVQSTGE